jgi:hypothetical protein
MKQFRLLCKGLRSGGVFLYGIFAVFLCLAMPVAAQESDPTPDAPQEKKKTVRKSAKSASASSEDIEALINEMAKKLKDAKEREQTERDEKKQALQEKIQKLNAEMQSLQRELGEVRGAAPAMNAAPSTSPSMMMPSSPPSVMTPMTPVPQGIPKRGRTAKNTNAAQPMPMMPEGSAMPPNRTQAGMPTSGMMPGMPSMQGQSMPVPNAPVMPNSNGEIMSRSANRTGMPLNPSTMNPVPTDNAGKGDRYRPRMKRAATENVPAATSAYSAPSVSPVYSQPVQPAAVQSTWKNPATMTSAECSRADWMIFSQDALNTYSALGEGKGLMSETGTAAGSGNMNNGGVFSPSLEPSVQSYQTGYGMTMIQEFAPDGSIQNKNYYEFALRPEAQYGNFAFGLDATLRFDDQGDLRKVDWQNFDDVLRAIRYVRYSSDLKGLFGETMQDQNSKVFLRVGQLENVTLGSGSIVSNYRSNASFDDRKVGAEVKVSTNEWRIEAFTSNLARAELVGARAELREVMQKEYFIKDIKLGATAAFDFAPTARRVAGGFDSAQPPGGGFVEQQSVSGSAIGLVGLDVLACVVQTGRYDVRLGIEYNRVVQNAVAQRAITGGAVDLEAAWRSENQKTEVVVGAKHIFSEGGFQPMYFNGLYEVERYRVIGQNINGNNLIQTKADGLVNSGNQPQRYFVGLKLNHKDQSATGLKREFWSEVSYMNAYNTSNDGLFYAAVGMENLIEKVGGYVRYFKRLTGQTPLFKADNHTVIRAELTARLSERVQLGAMYDWTFLPVYASDGITAIDFRPQQRLEPRINVNFMF